MWSKLVKKSLQGFTGFGSGYTKKPPNFEERSVLYLSLRSALASPAESHTGVASRDPRIRVDSFPCVRVHMIGTGGCTLMWHQSNGDQNSVQSTTAKTADVDTACHPVTTSDVWEESKLAFSNLSYWGVFLLDFWMKCWGLLLGFFPWNFLII